MSAPKILAFAGSLRADSYNKRLVQVAAQGARDAGAEVTFADLRDHPMPVFDEDLEKAEGKPDGAARFKALLMEHDGFLIACPEYNSSITAALKNAIDWASRGDDDDPGPLAAFRGKVVTVMAASPGGLGGLRGLVHVRAILGNIGCIVLPDQLAVPRAYEAFGDDGSLVDEKQQQRVLGLGANLAGVVARLATDPPAV